MWLMEGGILTAAVRYRWVRFPVPQFNIAEDRGWEEDGPWPSV